LPRRRRWIQIDEDIAMAEELSAGVFEPSAPPLQLVIHSPGQPPYNPHFEPPPAYHELYPSVPAFVASEYPQLSEGSSSRVLSKEEQEREDELFVAELVRREGLWAGLEPTAPREEEVLEGLTGPGGPRIFELDGEGHGQTELRRLDNRPGENQAEVVEYAGLPAQLGTLVASLVAAIPIAAHSDYIFDTLRTAPSYLSSFLHPTQPAPPNDLLEARRQQQNQPDRHNQPPEDWELVDPARIGVPGAREIPWGFYACPTCSAGTDRPGTVTPRTYLSWLPTALVSLVPKWEWTCPRCKGAGVLKRWWYSAGTGLVRVTGKAAKVATKGAVIAGGWCVIRQAAAAGGRGAGVAAGPVVVWGGRGVSAAVRAW